jgi:hypothetical protein
LALLSTIENGAIHFSSYSPMDNCIFLLLLAVIAPTTNGLVSCVRPASDQICLPFAGDTGVHVGWHLRLCPSDDTNPNPNPTVIFGKSPTELNFTSVNGNSSFYDPNTILGRSWFYSVELQNLEPSTVYYYQIAASNFVSASNIPSFMSAPALGNRSRPVNVATYGDLGIDGLLGFFTTGPCLFKQALDALQWKPLEIDFFLHHSDICYADDGPILIPPKSYEVTMDYCQVAMSVLTSVHFYMTAPLTYSKIASLL